MVFVDRSISAAVLGVALLLPAYTVVRALLAMRRGGDGAVLWQMEEHPGPL